MRHSTSFKLALLVAIVACAVNAHAVTYTAQILHPVGFTYSLGDGVSDVNQVGIGTGTATGYKYYALLWSGNPASAVVLHPTGFTESFAYATSGPSQVGKGFGPATGNATHALLWNGTAASFVYLNPAGFYSSVANDVSGTSQVGSGSGPATGNARHALLWNGTAASVVDLHPAGFTQSTAHGVYGTSQVGEGSGPATGNATHALLWNGTAASVVDLHPAGFESSAALGVSGTKQVGYGVSATVGSRALLWSGSAESVVDLHPTWLDSIFEWLGSEATAVSSAGQVGWGAGTATGLADHAIYWNGTADSAIDLHPFVAAIDPVLDRSRAYAIADNGSIVGFAEASTGLKQVAVLWTPVTDDVTGDYNGNGIVDAADYVVWRKTLGQTGPDQPADGNGNEEIDAGDYFVWRDNFGAAGGGAAAANTSQVPEPSTVWISVLTASALFARRRTARRDTNRERGASANQP